jgi:hypothetical protein
VCVSSDNPSFGASLAMVIVDIFVSTLNRTWMVCFSLWEGGMHNGLNDRADDS